MVLTESVLFIMPKDRELQFPAMAAMQRYVNDFQIKMAMNRVTAEVPEYRLRYNVEMPEEDWQFFQSIGIQLKQQREDIGWPDAVIEMQDERLLSFYNSTKHCAQVCSAISGTEAPPLPVVRQVRPDFSLKSIVTTMGDFLYAEPFMKGGQYLVQNATAEMIASAADGTIGCVIGEQRWETYMAASMGLPVIEILPRRKSINWLSKFRSPVYRLVEEDAMDRIPAALDSLKAVLRYLEAAGKKAANV